MGVGSESRQLSFSVLCLNITSAYSNPSYRDGKLGGHDLILEPESVILIFGQNKYPFVDYRVRCNYNSNIPNY